MNYEDLTKRIKKAEEAKQRSLNISSMKDFWDGYIAALNDVRNDFNTGGKA